MDISDRICRFCMKKSVDCKAIEGYVGEILEKLLLKVDLSISEEPVMCTSCVEMLMKCFDCKNMCLNTHKHIDLNNVFQSKKQNDVVFLEDQNICAICMGLVESCSTVSLESEGDVALEKILENYFPELSFGIISKPVICAACRASLQDHYSFMTNCLTVEEHIKKFCKATDINVKGQIKLNNLLHFISQNLFTHKEDCEEPSIIKIEQICGESDVDNDKSDRHCMNWNDQNVNNVFQPPSKSILFYEEDFKDFDLDKIKEEFTGELETKIEIDGNFVKTKDQMFYSCVKEKDEAEMEQLDIDRSQDGAVPHPEDATKILHGQINNLNHNNRQGNIQTPMKIDENPSKTTYHGESCSYQTNHKSRSETPMYKCDLCLYKSKYKASLTYHRITHKSPSETPMYACDLCSFTSKYKGSLQRHMVIHEIPSESQMFFCDLCSFKTRYKCSLVGHVATHKSKNIKQALEAPVYICGLCSFKSEDRYCLRSHLATHKSPSAPHMYACGLCSFKSKYKLSFRCHLASHASSLESSSETPIFTCNFCPFKAKYKHNLRQHLLSHKSPSETSMQTCNLCSFKSKYKKHLRQHMLSHKSASETPIYTCDLCLFKSKHKISVLRHMLTHKSPSETMYICNLCSFKSKYKGNLLKHIVVHTSLLETGKPI